jgi:flagellum-specific peptidoglycan hydrolase FlgJ
MSENLVPNVLTPCDPAAFCAAIKEAWPSLFSGETPSRASVLTLAAQWALETGWGHACHCWNVANRKYVQGCGHDYCQFPCGETENGVNVMHYPPDPTCNFVAYSSLEAGVVDYLIHFRAEFRAAWPAIEAGDPEQFGHLLKVARYYTAPEASYTAALVGCYHRLDTIIPPDPAPESTPTAA